jgi:hypothetical protein
MNMLINLFGFIETKNVLDELFDHFILKKNFGLLCYVGSFYVYVIVQRIVSFRHKASGLLLF